MAELILVRLTLFLVAFFALQRLLPHLIAKPQRWHGLIALAGATFVAFVIAALLLGDPMGQSLVAWALITFAIAVIWTLRWKTIDHERTIRQRRFEPGAPDDPISGAMLPTPSTDLDGSVKRDALFEIEAERIRNQTPGGS